LDQHLANVGAFTFQESVDIVLQALDAIAEAHALGIVHRDLKPANIFIATRPDQSTMVKVLDFGISKLPGEQISKASADITTGSQLLGSPSFMSPEQLISPNSVDAKSDIWALGVVLFELFAGYHPFRAKSMPQLCTLILSGNVPLVREHNPALPDQLEAIIGKCLAQDPSNRFADVGELALALEPFASPDISRLADRVVRILSNKRALTRETVTANVDIVPFGTPARAPTPPTQPAPPFPRRAAKRWWVAALFLGLVVSGVAAFMILQVKEPVTNSSSRTDSPIHSSAVEKDSLSAKPSHGDIVSSKGSAVLPQSGTVVRPQVTKPRVRPVVAPSSNNPLNMVIK